jgi:subtilase family serine protease
VRRAATGSLGGRFHGRWSRWRYLALLGLLVAVGAWWFARPLSPAAHGRPDKPVLLGATNPRTTIDFSLVLRLPGRLRLLRFLNGLEDPASPTYHHFIDATTFGERFGVSRGVLDQAAARLAADGVQVTHSYPQRTTLDVRSNAGTIDRLFGVRLMSWRGAGGRRFHAPVGEAIVPPDLRQAVAAVAGLDSAAVETRDATAIQSTTPGTATNAYDVSPLARQHITGRGESIAVVEFGQFEQSDLDGFDQQFGLPAVTPSDVPVDGGATDDSASSVAEADLDFEVAHEIAPGAELLDYSAPQSTGSGADTFGAVVDQIVADGKASIVSDSWGSCEPTTPASDIRRDEQAIEAAAARGISIFVAAGDTGAYTCQDNNASDHRLSVDWPASSPFAISVGGTSLSMTQTGAYQGETAWNDTLEQSGGGGGLSVDYARPDWQVGPGVSNSFSDGKRQLPDVAADADPWSGWDTYTGGAIQVAGGTSAAAPFWAAATSLIAQYAGEHGIRRLGFVDPMLYAVAARPQRGPGFHDITSGTNRYYPSTSGWDFATGLGSPDVYHLAQDVVAYTKR